MRLIIIEMHLIMQIRSVVYYFKVNKTGSSFFFCLWINLNQAHPILFILLSKLNNFNYTLAQH